MVVGRLNDSEEGLFLFRKSFVGFKEQVFVTYSPNIHRQCLKLAHGMHFYPVNIFDQAFKIVEAGATAKKIHFLVATKIVDNGTLV